jgi:hypothetical protein
MSSPLILDTHARMDEDDANKTLLESPINESNVHVATLSEVPPDDISRIDEPVLK